MVDLIPTDKATFLKTHLAEQAAVAKPETSADPAGESVSANPRHGGLAGKLAASTPIEPAPACAVPRPKPEPGQVAEKPQPAPSSNRARKERGVIVIDPGHGGIDPGAIGIGKTKEKDVVLAFCHGPPRSAEGDRNLTSS